MIIDANAKYEDTASKDRIVYSVWSTMEYSIRLLDAQGNFLTVGYHRFNNDFKKVK